MVSEKVSVMVFEKVSVMVSEKVSVMVSEKVSVMVSEKVPVTVQKKVTVSVTVQKKVMVLKKLSVALRISFFYYVFSFFCNATFFSLENHLLNNTEILRTHLMIRVNTSFFINFVEDRFEKK